MPEMVDDFPHKNSYLLGLSEEEPSVSQADLLLLPKDQEMIEISDDEEIEDTIVVVVSYDVMYSHCMHACAPRA